MGYIDNLLRRRKVEWKTLGEVFDIRNGYTPSKKNKDYWTDGTIPWFRMEDLRLNGGILDDALQHITPQAIRGKGLFKANSIIMATTATIGEHALLIADSLANQQFTNFSIRKSLSDTLLPKFVYYYFFVLDEWCKQNVKIGNFPSVEIDRLKKQPFPLPPLDVQVEIARILDRFTALEAELEAELEARQKQYEYYRDLLLTFDKTRTDVEWKALGEVAKLYGGLNGKRKQDFQNGNVQFITYKNVYDHIEVNPKELALVRVDENERQNAVRYGDVLITGSSETMEDVGMASAVTTHYERPIYLNSFSFGIRFFEGIPLTPEFAKYLFRSPVLRRQIVKTASGVTRFNISKSRFNLIHIPLPPLAEQERIVRILDKFSTLTTSLTAGLPREIALRRRQYEYYREQLLSFE